MKKNYMSVIMSVVLCALIMVAFTQLLSVIKSAQEQKARYDEYTASSSSDSQEAVEAMAPAADPEPITIEEYIKGMSLHDKVCQLFIVTPEELQSSSKKIQTADEKTENALKKYPVGGVVYFSKNIKSAKQIKKMLKQTKAYAAEHSNIPLFTAVDEEGGTVARCAQNAGTTKFEPMYTYRKSGEETAYSNAKTIAEDISGLGFNLNFAPVADTWSNKYSYVIGERAYSSDYEQTAELVSSAVQGFSDGGVCCTLKHFPGLGDASVDPHYEIPYISREKSQFRKYEYVAFQDGINAGADMVMMGHLIASEIDAKNPASLSKKIIQDELRDYLGYEGVIITDSLEMDSVTDKYSCGKLAVKAFKAGNDMLLMPENLHDAVHAIKQAVKDGDISEEELDERVARILTLKQNKLGDSFLLK